MPDLRRDVTPSPAAHATALPLDTPDLRAVAGREQAPGQGQVDFDVVSDIVNARLAGLPPGVVVLATHPQQNVVDVILAEQPDGEKSLYIDGCLAHLNPKINHSPETFYGILLACQSPNALRDHVEAIRSLSRRNLAQQLMVVRNDDSARESYFGDKLGSELPQGYYSRNLADPNSWMGPYPTHNQAVERPILPPCLVANIDLAPAKVPMAHLEVLDATASREVRREAMEMALAYGGPGDAQLAFATLRTISDPYDRLHVSCAIKDQRFRPGCPDVLLELARTDPDFGIRRNSIEGLRGHPFAWRLDAVLREDVNPIVRIEAARSIGMTRLNQCAQPLLDALRDPVPDVQIAAAKALGYLGGAGEADALSRAAEGVCSNPMVNEAFHEAAETIRLRHDPNALAEWMIDAKDVLLKSPRDRRSEGPRMANRLGVIDTEEAVDLLAEVITNSYSGNTKDGAFMALREVGALTFKAEEALIQALALPADSWKALPVLSIHGCTRAIPQIAALCNKSWLGYRDDVVEALGSTRHPDAIPYLLDALRGGEADLTVRRRGMDDVQVAAVLALSKIDDPGVIPVLTEALYGSSERVRIHAMLAIAKQKPEALGPILNYRAGMVHIEPRERRYTVGYGLN